MLKILNCYKYRKYRIFTKYFVKNVNYSKNLEYWESRGQLYGMVEFRELREFGILEMIQLLRSFKLLQIFGHILENIGSAK